MDGPDRGPDSARLPLLKAHGGKIAYFAGGILFLGLSRFFVPFWVRWLVLIAWALGLVALFIRVMERAEKGTGD